MSTISKYFSNRSVTSKKRKPSSSSSSAGEFSPESVSTKTRQDKKKIKNTDSDIDEDMALQESLCEIKATMTKLATKEDITELRQEMERLTASLTTRIEKVESAVFDLQKEKDELKAEVSQLRRERAELQGRVEQQGKEASNIRFQLNDQEQHGRQWNLRVYGVQEATGETTEDCVSKCVEIFSKKLKVPVSSKDIEIAHRSGKKAVGSGKPRPILIRFHSRRQRGVVLKARRALKQTGISIAEDLTQANYRLLQKVSGHAATSASWSSNGKIWAQMKKSGKTFKVDLNTNIDVLFAKEM